MIRYQATKFDGLVVAIDDTTGDQWMVAPATHEWDRYQEWLTAGNTLAPADEPSRTSYLASQRDRIDAYAASIYARWTRFSAEYAARETAAKAFKDAGYQGDPGGYVTSFAQAAAITNRQAADTILGQAAALHTAQERIAALRMGKYGLASLPTDDEVEQHVLQIVAEMDTVAGAMA